VFLMFDSHKAGHLKKLKNMSKPGEMEIRLEFDNGFCQILCKTADQADRLKQVVEQITAVKKPPSSYHAAKPLLGAMQPLIPPRAPTKSSRHTDDLMATGGNNLSKSGSQPVEKGNAQLSDFADLPSESPSSNGGLAHDRRPYAGESTTHAGASSGGGASEELDRQFGEAAAKRARIDALSGTCQENNRSPEKSSNKKVFYGVSTQGPRREKQQSSQPMLQFRKPSSSVQASASYQSYRSVTFGLQNLGNTCYLNAVMQALCSLREFVTNLQGMPAVIPQVGECKLYSGSLEILEQMRKANSGGYLSGPLSPGKLRELIAKASPMFATNRQQDAHEFLLEYVNQLHDGLLGARRTWLDSQNMIDDESLGVLSTQLFLDSEVQKTLQCVNCQESRDVSERFRDFSLDFPARPATVTVGRDDTCELRSMLVNYFARELLEVRCEPCGAAAAHMSKHLTLAPRVLVLHLKRFVPNLEKQVYEKQHQLVDIPLSFDLKAYLKDAYAGTNDLEAGSPVKQGQPTLPARPLAAEATAANQGYQPRPVWEVLLSQDFEPFDTEVTRQLEENYCKDPNGRCEIQVPPVHGRKYMVDFATLEQVNVESKMSRPIRRRVPGSPSPASDGLLDEFAGGPVYNLRAVVAHDGASPHSGHYVTYARGETGSWRLFDDSFVKELPNGQDTLRSLGRKAYILFYVLQQ